MGIVIKQSIRSSIIAYIGVVIGYINLLWLYPYFMTPEQVGLMRVIQSSAFLMATFGQFGLPQVTIRFFPQLKAEKGFLTLLMTGGVIGFLLLCTLALFFKPYIISYFSEDSPLFIDYFLTTLIISAFLVQFQVLESFCRNHLKIFVPTIIRDVQLRLGTMALVLLFAFDIIDFDVMVKSLVLIFFSIGVSMVVYLNYLKTFKISFNFDFLKNGTFKKILTYGLYSLLGAGGTQIVLQIDSVMVTGELGLDATGIYTIAFFIGVVIEMPKRAITQISAALISQSFQKGDMKHVLTLYRQTSINQMIIGSLLLIGVWSNLESIYHFIPNGEIYLTGMNVVLFIGLGKLSDMLFGVNGEIIVMSKYYRFNVLAISLLAVITIVLNLWLMPIYGIEGAAIASMVAMFSFNFAKFLFVSWRLKMQPFTLKTLIFLGIAALAILANYLIPKLDIVLIDILVRSSIITFIVVGGAYSLKVSPEVCKLIDQTVNKLRGK